MNEEMNRQVRRPFRVHAGILQTLFREQGGSFSKAIAELVMNAIDARATEIRIETSKEHGRLTISDNGKGFADLTEIQEFFETFGTPHHEGDAKFGRFRIGRGQVMGYAKTRWLSGKYEMLVDIQDAAGEFGYELRSLSQARLGCTIEVELYEKRDILEVMLLYGKHVDLSEANTLLPLYGDNHLSQLVRYVSVPILIDGVQINQLVEHLDWDFDELAFYKLDRDFHDLRIYNQGVFVESVPAARFGIGGVVVSRVTLHVNAARNAIVKCEHWRKIAGRLIERFTVQVEKARKLRPPEIQRLLRDLVFEDRSMSAKSLEKLRFLPDIFGVYQDRRWLFPEHRRFTCFDRKKRMIAERVTNLGIVTVIDPVLLHLAGIEVSNNNAHWLVQQLRLRLALNEDSDPGRMQWIDFETLAQEFSDTATVFDDDQMDRRAQVAIEALRSINKFAANICGSQTRKLVGGASDSMDAWTDGVSYIAIEHRQLETVGQLAGYRWTSEYRPGLFRLVYLLIHEYGHKSSSQGDHCHDPEFYVRFHNTILHPGVHLLMENLYKAHVKSLIKQRMRAPTATGSFVRWCASVAPKLRSRGSDEVRAAPLRIKPTA